MICLTRLFEWKGSHQIGRLNFLVHCATRDRVVQLPPIPHRIHFIMHLGDRILVTICQTYMETRVTVLMDTIITMCKLTNRGIALLLCPSKSVIESYHSAIIFR